MVSLAFENGFEGLAKPGIAQRIKNRIYRTVQVTLTHSKRYIKDYNIIYR